MAALCMLGEREWPTGSPRMTKSRVLAPISMLPFLHEALDYGGDQGLKLGAGVAVDVEVAAEGVAHLGLVALAAPVLPQHEHPPLPAELIHDGAVGTGHGEDEIGFLHPLPGEQPRAVTREVKAALQAHKISPLGGGPSAPCSRPGRGAAHAVPPPLLK